MIANGACMAIVRYRLHEPATTVIRVAVYDVNQPAATVSPRLHWGEPASFVKNGLRPTAAPLSRYQRPK